MHNNAESSFVLLKLCDLLDYLQNVETQILTKIKWLISGKQNLRNLTWPRSITSIFILVIVCITTIVSVHDTEIHKLCVSRSAYDAFVYTI